MDWARDNAGLTDKDLEIVFKYEEKSTVVVQMLLGQKTPVIDSLKGDREWQDWIQNVCPRISGGTSGLVLILAKRTGEPSFASVKKAQSNDWLERMNGECPGRSDTQHTFAALSEKRQPTGLGSDTSGVNAGGERKVRKLPFSKNVFQRITKSFHIHNSISRVISRADVPIFSSAEVQMKGDDERSHQAYVYNCRSSNSWDLDLALTATYFPHCGLTFALLFGCPLTVEREILRRLSFAMAEATHPLLMPGIFAELERSRHIELVEAMIDDMEARIFELDFGPSKMEGISGPEAEEQNHGKRTAWLDTTYLRNGLISWNTQLRKISDHADLLNSTVFKSPASTIAGCDVANNIADTSMENEGRMDLANTKAQLQRIGLKIAARIQGIINEYDDKIRDCTMRIDGMAMATQWAHSETNVEIALATGRDSRHMRSIALVTMIFLPGTFLATVFSMTFFNWSGTGTVVSRYIWIYVVITILCTIMTIGSWWYFVAYRRFKHRKHVSVEEVPLVRI